MRRRLTRKGWRAEWTKPGALRSEAKSLQSITVQFTCYTPQLSNYIGSLSTQPREGWSSGPKRAKTTAVCLDGWMDSQRSQLPPATGDLASLLLWHHDQDLLSTLKTLIDLPAFRLNRWLEENYLFTFYCLNAHLENVILDWATFTLTRRPWVCSCVSGSICRVWGSELVFFFF